MNWQMNLTSAVAKGPDGGAKALTGSALRHAHVFCMTVAGGTKTGGREGCDGATRGWRWTEGWTEARERRKLERVVQSRIDMRER